MEERARWAEEAAKKQAELLARTPNPEQYIVVDVQSVGPHIVMCVQYTTCKNCSFDSKKTMVFLDTAMRDVAMWRHIDPHFSEQPKTQDRHKAPPPRARFPGDQQGWQDALAWAQAKVDQKKNMGHR